MKPYLIHRWRELQSARFDRRLGISTRGEEADLASLGARGQHVQNANAYEAIQIGVFHRILRALPPDLDRYQFVDFGCGRGRALILAAEAGFARVIGVEFARTLCTECATNIDTYRRVNPESSPIDLYCQDAATFHIPSRDTVLFLYNPFDAVVMKKVLDVVEADWRRDRHDLIVAYRNAEEAAVLDTAPWLQPVAAEPAFCLYRAIR